MKEINIETATPAELIEAMKAHDNLGNQQMVDAMKKIFDDKEFMHDLIYSDPIMVTALARTWAQSKMMASSLGVKL